MLEPIGRNTGPAITAAAIALAEKEPEAIMLVQPADHRIGAAEQYHAAIRAGLEIPILRDGTQQALRKLMPARATSTNPIDVAGAADEDPLSFAWLTEVCLKDPTVDGVIITGLLGGYRWLLSEDFGPREEAAARELGRLVREYHKPVLVQTIYARHDIPALKILREEGVPYYESIEITCRAMAALAEIGQFLAQ